MSTSIHLYVPDHYKKIGHSTLAGLVLAVFLNPAYVAASIEEQQPASIGKCVQHTALENSSSIPSSIIFETTFAQDVGYDVADVNDTNMSASGPVNPPNGWDGIKATQGSRVQTLVGEGVNGSNALKLEWGATAAQPSIKLLKHLTGDKNVGFDEIFVRYNVRLPPNFRAGGDRQTKPYWKWGRLWQNTNPTPDETWGGRRPDSGYIVWNLGGDGPHTKFGAVFAENQRADGLSPPPPNQRIAAQQSVTFAPWGADQTRTPGFFENVGNGAWALDLDSENPGFLKDRNQIFHTIEYRFKLATSDTADDGAYEIFIDGVSVGPIRRIVGIQGALTDKEGIPTARKGSGINFLNLFDNMAGWNADWSNPNVDGYILLSDVVVSRSRIGHEYIAK